MSAVRTYGWYPGEGDIVGAYGTRQDLAARVMRESIAKGMRRKGLRPAEGDTPDVLVAYQLGISSRREISGFRTVEQNGSAYAVPERVTIYRNGTILIYLFDPTAGDIVWMGSASAENKAADDDAEVRSRLERGVGAVFDAMKIPKPSRRT